MLMRFQLRQIGWGYTRLIKKHLYIRIVKDEWHEEKQREGGDEVAGTGGVGASFSNVIRKNVPDRMF